MTEKTWPERSKRPATPAVLNDEGRMMRKRQKKQQTRTGSKTLESYLYRI